MAETWQAQGGRERLNQLANKYAAIFKARVTFIDLQGTVVGESQYDSALMGAALILLVMVLILNIASTLILRRLMGRVRRAW